MVLAADVELIGREQEGAGLVIAPVRGDVGGLVRVHVIPPLPQRGGAHSPPAPRLEDYSAIMA